MAFNQIFVVNAGDLQDHAFTDPSAVPADVVAAFDGAGSVLIIDDAGDTGDESAVPDQIQFVLGGTEPRLSQLIDTDTMKVEKRAYAAAVAQVSTVSAVPAGAADAEDAIVRVEDMSERPNFERLTYSVPVLSGDSAADIVDKLVAAINGNEASVVTASRSTNDLVLTADEAGESFATSLDGHLIDATLTATTAPHPGYGTYEHVRELEIQAFSAYGEYYQNDGLLGSRAKPTVFAESGEQYDLYIVSSKNSNDTAINKSFAYSELVIAVSSNATGDLDTFLAAYL